MTKKNTLLYLDRNLVELAKRHDLNLSEVAEAAIRSRLLPILSQSERTLDFPQHLDDLKKEGYCYLLPQTIESVKIENIGPLERLELSFDRGLNVVLGSAGSGKTVLVKTLAYAFGVLGSEKPHYTLTHEKNSGTVAIKPYPGEVRVTIKSDKLERIISRENVCALLDEPVVMLTKEGKHRFLEWINEKFDQAIIVSQCEDFIESGNTKTLRLNSIGSIVNDPWYETGIKK